MIRRSQRKSTFVTAALNSRSDMGCSVLFEKVNDIVITAVFAGSRVTCKEILRPVSFTAIVFEAGPSGNADEKAHSSSSAAGAGAAAGAFDGGG